MKPGVRKGTTEEQIKHKDKLDQLISIVGLKQEQTLIKYLFRPFWGATAATTGLLTGILLGVGSWPVAGVLAVVVCYSLYTCLKLRARLKILNSVLGIW